MRSQQLLNTLKTENSISVAEELRVHFSNYLQVVFKGLLCLQKKSQKTELSGNTEHKEPDTIKLPVFHQFCRLPLALTSALFYVIGKGHDLDQRSFTSCFQQLYLGDVDHKLALAFQLMAGQRRDTLVEDDLRSLLYHTIKAGSCANKCFDKLRPQNPKRLEQRVDAAIERLCSEQPLNHNKKHVISSLHFYQFSKLYDSDIPQLLLCTIYSSLKLLEKFKKFELGVARESEISALTENLQFGAEFYGFSEIGHVRYLNNDLPAIRQIWHLNFTSSEEEKESNSGSDQSAYIKGQRTSINQEESILARLGFIEREPLQQFTNFAGKEKHGQSLRKAREQESDNEESLYSQCCGHVYRFVKENTIRAFWYELHGSDLYMFRTKSSPKPKMILTLGPGFSVTDKPDPDKSPKAGNLSNKPLYSFELIFPSGLKKEFLFFNAFEKRTWLMAFESLLGSFDFDQEYELLNEVEEIEGEVAYKGFSLETGESVVISILPKRADLNIPEFQQDYEERLLSRLEVLRICKHPLIPDLIDIHETADHFYIAQQPTEGGDLASYIQRQGITEKAVGHILSQMAEVMCFLSKMNVVVGNLKLQSFFLAEAISPSDFTTLPQIRLVDLSEATIKCPSTIIQPSPSLSLYSAPEMIESESSAVGVKADAFSLGVIFHQILFQKLPFSNFQQLQEEEPVMSSNCKFFKEYLPSLIRKLLVKDQSSRLNIEGFVRFTSLVL